MKKPRRVEPARGHRHGVVTQPNPCEVAGDQEELLERGELKWVICVSAGQWGASEGLYEGEGQHQSRSITLPSAGRKDQGGRQDRSCITKDAECQAKEHRFPHR